jgi:hypothetical protein
MAPYIVCPSGSVLNVRHQAIFHCSPSHPLHRCLIHPTVSHSHVIDLVTPLISHLCPLMLSEQLLHVAAKEESSNAAVIASWPLKAQVEMSEPPVLAAGISWLKSGSVSTSTLCRTPLSV